MMAVIVLVGFALLLLCCVVVVAIVVFSRTARMVVARTRQEDLPRVLESVGRTLSGLVAALGRGMRQALSAGSRGGAAQPSALPAPNGVVAEPCAATPADTSMTESETASEAR